MGEDTQGSKSAKRKLGPMPVATAVETPAEAPENHLRLVWAFAWPAVALNSLQVLNNLLDRFFIGHLQQAALSAQSAAMNLTFLLFSVAFALATGSSAIVSRAFGAGDESEYRRAAQESVNLAIGISILIAALSFAFTPMVAGLVLPGDAHEAQRLMVQFVVIFALGLPGMYVIQALASSLRGVGDTKSPMVISGLQILVHMSLNCLLIFPTRTAHIAGHAFTMPGAGMGLAGAATALTVSSWIAAISYLLYCRHTPLGSMTHFRLPNLDWARRILRIAMPSMAMSILRVFSLTAFTMIIAKVPSGESAIAGMGVAFAIEAIMFMPVFGLAVATSALVGQSLGMEKPKRAEHITWVASHSGALIVLAVVVPLYFSAPMIARTMIADGAPTTLATAAQEILAKATSRQEAVNLIRWLCSTEVLFCYAMVLTSAMQGAGDTRTPFWITVSSLWMMRVPLAWFLAIPMAMGATGAWASMSISQAVQGALAIVAFRKGNWKAQKV